MASERTREKIVELIRKMREQTAEKGCAPAEAAGFAAKVAEWIERYQISEAELRGVSTGTPELEVCENKLNTGKRVFNPGMTQVVNSLAQAMCCKCILLHEGGNAVYGIIGDQLDADYVCQIAVTVVPALQIMATLEGREHGYEKAGLVRWSNQYLTGAAQEIKRRIENERKGRAEAKEHEHRVSTSLHSTALVCITGETIAAHKREVVAEAFREAYPRTRASHSRSEYNHTANERGREAGKRVGLNVQIEG